MFHVYVDVKPTGEPFYVGKGLAPRIKKWDRGRHHSAISKKYPGCERVIILSTTDEQLAFEKERLAIEAFGRRVEGGLLINLTDGGEGCAGRILSADTRAKISQRIDRAKVSAALKLAYADGRRKRGHSTETRAKISAVQVGRKHSAETRAKMSAAHSGKQYRLGQKEAPDKIEKRLDTMRSPEGRKANSERIKAAWARGDYANRRKSA